MSEAQDPIHVSLAKQFGLPCPVTGEEPIFQPKRKTKTLPKTATWSNNGKDYEVTDSNEKKHLLFIEVPVNDIFDHYASRSSESLKQALNTTKNPLLQEVIKSVLNESEWTGQDSITLAIYDGVKRPKAAYNPTAATELSLVATVLQGKDDKFEAALAECAKRGIRFTIKQQAAAAKRGRDLTY